MCAGASWREALSALGGGQKVLSEMYHREQTEENANRQILGVSRAQGIALSVSLVFLNTLQEAHFSPNGFALLHGKSTSLVFMVRDKHRLCSVFYTDAGGSCQKTEPHEWHLEKQRHRH